MPSVADWVRDCLAGRRAGCVKLYEYLWLAPRIARELKSLGHLAIVPIPKPWPGPDPSPELDAGFLREGAIVRDVLFRDPSPQPNILSRADRLKAATSLRSGLSAALKALDAEIENLQKKG